MTSLPLTSLEQASGGSDVKGFPHEVLIIHDDKYFCGLCGLVLWSVQTQCGHRLVLEAKKPSTAWVSIIYFDRLYIIIISNDAQWYQCKSW